MSDTAGRFAETVIEMAGLTMRYGAFEAVQGLDLHVMRGEVFAFLGPNGAGKTTTVEILEGTSATHGGRGARPWTGPGAGRAHEREHPSEPPVERAPQEVQETPPRAAATESLPDPRLNRNGGTSARSHSHLRSHAVVFAAA
jgi:ATPase subunit of ABC transporter with duplicated ATPase domains